MRSRLDDIDPAAAVEWALTAGFVGVGERGTPQEDDRIRARLRRFADVDDGSFVWTRDGEGMLFVGRITGPLRQEAEGAMFDLGQVRPCRWWHSPVETASAPPAVRASFDRGGRNFQRIRAEGVELQTSRLWLRFEAPSRGTCRLPSRPSG